MKRRLKRMVKWTGIVIASALALLLATGATVQALSTRAAFRRYKAPGRMVDVGGYKLHIHCTGEAHENVPTVVLESGLGGWTIDWASVQPEIAKTSRVCSYDRSGHGWSERGPSSAGTRAGIAKQLHALLQAAHVPGPYVLVGHSLGGMYIREFARRYPSDVVGMVFVDSSHEEMGKKATSAERKEAVGQMKMLRFLRYLMPFGAQRLVKQPVSNAKDLSEADRPIAYGIGYKTGAYFAFYDEASSLLGEDEGGTLRLDRVPDVPIVTIAAESNVQKQDWWLGLQTELSELSSDGELVIAEGSGHFVHVDKPHLVIEAIEKIVKKGVNREEEAS
ncbi:MAG: alpha/beta hydrolase [Actinomycetota bacterium]